MDTQLTTPRQQWFETREQRSVRLATESCGVGQPFLWAHALLGSMAQDLEGGVLAWRELTDMAKVIRFDARGHGQSGCEGTPEDYAWEALARTLWQVADSYTSEQLILGGASMGCATALHAACQRPEQVSGLVLVIPPTAWESRVKMKRNYRFMAKLVGITRALPFRLLGLIPAASAKDTFRRKTLSVMARHLRAVKPRGVVGAMRGAALSDLPSPESLKNLTMPTLILAWPEDDTHPLAVAEQLQGYLPNSQLHVMENEDDPYRWPQRAREFIASLK